MERKSTGAPAPDQEAFAPPAETRRRHAAGAPPDRETPDRGAPVRPTLDPKTPDRTARGQPHPALAVPACAGSGHAAHASETRLPDAGPDHAPDGTPDCFSPGCSAAGVCPLGASAHDLRQLAVPTGDAPEGAPFRDNPCQFARAERAVMLRRYARARIANLPLCLAAAATTFLIALQFAPPLVCAAVFLPALLAEAAERLALRGVARMPERQRARPATLRRVHLVGGANVAVTVVCLLALAAIGGPDMVSLVSAVTLGLSAYSALVHDMLPRLNLIRQAALLAVFLSPYALTLADQWPHPSRAAAVGMMASVMLAALLAVIYAHLHRNAARRLRAQREISRARREAEQRARALLKVRDEAERAALHDALTGLPNRRFLDRVLDGIAARDASALRRDDRADSRLAVMLIDLDRFKAINDTLGHDAGDRVLRRMADILRACVREGDFVARIGGDEFVIVAACTRPEETALAMAGRIIEEARRPIPYRGQLCRYGATVGIAFLRPGHDSPRRTLADADLALYRAKRLGRGRAELFGEALRREADAARRLTDDIARGLEQAEFEPWYQPRVSLSDGVVTGIEGVARWRHPERGILAPADFLHAAAEAGTLTEIDRAMLARALSDRAGWRDPGPDGECPPLTLNAGRGLLADPVLAGLIRAAALPPGALAFALSDSHRAGDSDDPLRWTADLLTSLGADAELSDFGVGRAGVSTLLALRPRRIKIHRQVLRHGLGTAPGREVIRALAAMAAALEIEVIAEGVETRSHARIAAGLGCGVAQGYAVAAPMPADRIGPWLAAAAARPPLGPFFGSDGPEARRRAPAH